MLKTCRSAPTRVPVARISALYSALWSLNYREYEVERTPLSTELPPGRIRDGASYGRDRTDGDKFRPMNLPPWLCSALAISIGRGRPGSGLRGHEQDTQRRQINRAI